MDLLAVVRRCCQGESSAWEQFLPSFAELGRRVLRAFTLSKVDQEEILCRALASLYEGGLQQFRGGSTGVLVVYLKSVVYNEALTFLKRQRREVPDPKAGARTASDDTVADVSTRLAEEECLQILEKIVAELPRSDRELYLMKGRGLKEREIAEQTGSPPGTVAARISRLIHRLRERLSARGC